MMHHGGKRSQFEIIAEILRLEGEGTCEIMAVANLSHAQLEYYLPALVEGGFTVQLPGQGRFTPYKLTDKGRELLKCIDRVLELLPVCAFGGKE